MKKGFETYFWLQSTYQAQKEILLYYYMTSYILWYWMAHFKGITRGKKNERNITEFIMMNISWDHKPRKKGQNMEWLYMR